MSASDVIQWTQENTELRSGNSAESLYDGWESQSAEQLAVIYQPFDGSSRGTSWIVVRSSTSPSAAPGVVFWTSGPATDGRRL